MELGGLGGFLGYKLPLDWPKIGSNSVEKTVTIFENTTGQLIWKSNFPLTNCCNLVVKDVCSSAAY